MSNLLPPGADIINHLTRKTALNGSYPLSLVEKLVRFQFMSVADATGSFDTVELSGIGYLYCSASKTENKLNRALKILSCYLQKLQTNMSAVRHNTLLKRIDSIKSTIKTYEDRLERTRTRHL